MSEINRVYIHVPFCSNKCGYCSFHSVPSPEEYLIEAYLEKLQLDINSANIKSPLKSLYLGGGTPSYLSEQNLERLIGILKSFNFDANSEISIECNPESLTDSKIRLISNFANRVSLGVQSFNEQCRKNIGRTGSALKIASIIDSFQKVGIANISCDLIYGIPSQSIDDFKDDLNKLLSLPIKHFSAYSLTIEENSQLDGTLSGHELEEIDETSSIIWEFLPELIGSRNFKRYEVSNYALSGFECEHNYSIWFGASYIGFGPTASSFDGINRWTQLELSPWLKNEPPIIDSISHEKRVSEIFAMGLRTSGLWMVKSRNNKIEINSQFGYSFNLSLELWEVLLSKLLTLKDQDLISIETSCLQEIKVKSTLKGIAFWNDIAMNII